MKPFAFTRPADAAEAVRVASSVYPARNMPESTATIRFEEGRYIAEIGAADLGTGAWTVLGLSMTLHETSVMDPRIGQVANHDLAEYHITANADVTSIEAQWLDEHDPFINPMGSKGIGEIGIVGTSAAIANAIHHATGVRVRDLPVTLGKLLAALPRQSSPG